METLTETTAIAKKAGSYHHKNLRAALIQLTEEIIATEGLEQVTLRELGTRLGVSRSAPYRHFKDKSSLLAVVSRDSYMRLNAALLAGFQENDSAMTQFQSLVDRYVQFALAHPNHYRLMFGQGFQPGDHFPEVAEVADETFSIIAQALYLCQKQGLLNSEDLGAKGSVVWAAIHGLTDMLLEGKLPAPDRESYVGLLAKTLIQGLSA